MLDEHDYMNDMNRQEKRMLVALDNGTEIMQPSIINHPYKFEAT